MKAVRLLEYGGQLVFNDAPTPTIARDEIFGQGQEYHRQSSGCAADSCFRFFEVYPRVKTVEHFRHRF